MSVVKSNIKLTSKNIFDIVSLPYLLLNQLFITPVTSGVSNSFQWPLQANSISRGLDQCNHCI